MSHPRPSTPPPLDSDGRSKRLTYRTQIVWSIVDAARDCIVDTPSITAKTTLRARIRALDDYDAQMGSTKT